MKKQTYTLGFILSFLLILGSGKHLEAQNPSIDSITGVWYSQMNDAPIYITKKNKDTVRMLTPQSYKELGRSESNPQLYRFVKHFSKKMPARFRTRIYSLRMRNRDTLEVRSEDMIYFATRKECAPQGIKQ